MAFVFEVYVSLLCVALQGKPMITEVCGLDSLSVYSANKCNSVLGCLKVATLKEYVLLTFLLYAAFNLG